MADNDDPVYGGGPRMSAVLAARKRFMKAQDKETRERAFRIRAGMQALLVECQCLYPLGTYDTESKHAAWCPSHGTWESQQAARKIYGGGM
jgi:hypothetical protein